MIRALLWSGCRERLARPIVVILLAVGSAAMLAGSVVGTNEDLVQPSAIMTLIFAVGLVGRDASSGALALLLTRPIRRWQYLGAKWVGAALAATTFSWLHLVVQCFTFHLQHKGVEVGSLLELAFGSMTGSFGLAAVLLLLSTVVPGIGDLGLWVALQLAVAVAGDLGLPQSIGEKLDALTSPMLDWGTAVHAGTGSFLAIVSYCSDVTVCLALAVWAMNRKQVSYANT